MLFLAFDGVEDLVIDHNTGFQDGSVMYTEGAPHIGFVYRDNIAPHNDYGVHGTGASPGTGTLGTSFPRSLFAGNVEVWRAIFWRFFVPEQQRRLATQPTRIVLSCK